MPSMWQGIQSKFQSDNTLSKAYRLQTVCVRTVPQGISTKSRPTTTQGNAACRYGTAAALATRPPSTCRTIVSHGIRLRKFVANLLCNLKLVTTLFCNALKVDMGNMQTQCVRNVSITMWRLAHCLWPYFKFQINCVNIVKIK